MSTPEPQIPHVDAAGWVLGVLEPDERAAFDAHLRDCDDCRRSVAELRGPAELLRRAAPAVELPADLRERTLAAVEAAAEGQAPPLRRHRATRPAWLRRPALALAAAVAAVVLATIVLVAVDDDGSREPELELAATLRAPRGGGGGEARVEVVETGIGRTITLRTDDLPILPKGDYYELWFVGPGDSRRRPNRISAGTFHPDEQGRSNVRLTAAVDPKKYPVLSVTAEPSDGDPARTGPEVLRGR